MPRVKEESGNKYNRLLVLCRTTKREKQIKGSGRHTRWLCLCDCGKLTTVPSNDLRSGHTKSCGCFSVDRATERVKTHGLSRTPVFTRYIGMMDRCNNINNKFYPNYGGRGVKVCKEWSQSFESFYTWAISNGFRKNLVIDRIDNNGDYSPGNCRFVTDYVNAHNKPSIRKNNTSGYVGVSKHKTGYWMSRIGSKTFSGMTNKEKYLGLFSTPEEACEVRNKYIVENGLPHEVQEVSPVDTEE